MELALVLLAIGDYSKQGRLIPPAKKRRGKDYRPIVLPALQAAKIELYRPFPAHGHSENPGFRRWPVYVHKYSESFSCKRCNQLTRQSSL